MINVKCYFHFCFQSNFVFSHDSVQGREEDNLGLHVIFIENNLIAGMLLLILLIPEPNKRLCHLQKLSCRVIATRKTILRALKLLMLGLFLQGDLPYIHVLASSIPEFIHFFFFAVTLQVKVNCLAVTVVY